MNKIKDKLNIIFIIPIVFVFLVVLIFYPLSFVYAAIPQVINYQSRLRDVSGSPVTGTTIIQFSIYNHLTNGLASDSAGSSGPLLWKETYDQVSGDCVLIDPDSEGYFSVQLGNCIAFPSYIDFNSPLYLGVKIESDSEASPRVLLSSYTYAFNADAVDAIHASSTAVINQILSLDSNLGFDIATGTFSGAGFTLASTTATSTIAGNFSVTGQVSMATATVSMLNNTNASTSLLTVSNGSWFTGGSIFDNATTTNLYVSGNGIFNSNIGIGTTTPYERLSVNGGIVSSYINATSTTATSTFAWGLQANALNITSSSATSTFANGLDLTAGCFSINGTCVGGGGGTPGGSDGQLQYNNGGSFGGGASLYWDDGNNYLGIGTSTPVNKLQILDTGTAKSIIDIANVVNNVNAVDMDGTGVGYSGTLWYYDATAPGPSPAGGIYWTAENDWTSTDNTRDSIVRIKTALDGVSVDKLTINSSGNVAYPTTNRFGIGASASPPETNLYIAGTFGTVDSVQSNLNIRDITSATTNTGAAITFQGNTNAGSGNQTHGYIRGAKENSTAANTQAYLSFGTSNSSGNNVEGMRLSSDQYLGIGTTSPYARLSVVGETVSAYFTATTTATSTFAGGIQTNLLNVTSSTATSTFANGLDLTAGCFSINGTCVGGGSSYGDSDVNTYIHASTTIPKLYTDNIWTGNNIFANSTTTNATTTTLAVSNASQLGTIISGLWNGTAIGDAYLTKTGNWTGTLDTYEASSLLARVNHTGTQAASTITTGTFGIGDYTFPSNLIVGGYASSSYFYATSTTATSTFAWGLQANALNITSSSATSTFANGLDLTAGCFSINGTCVGGGGSGTVNSGLIGQIGYYDVDDSIISGTSTLFISSESYVGVGTSTPPYNFSVELPTYSKSTIGFNDQTVGGGPGTENYAVMRLKRHDGTTETAGFSMIFESADGTQSNFFGIGLNGRAGFGLTGGEPSSQLGIAGGVAIGDTSYSGPAATTTATGELFAQTRINIGTQNQYSMLNVYGGMQVCTTDDVSCPTFVNADGDIYATTRSGGAIDVAEWFKVGNANLDSDNKSLIESADMVCADTASSNKVVLCGENEPSVILGAVSTKPHLTMGTEFAGEDAVRVALVGRVPVKVNLEGGEISIGDKIAISSIKGVGKKADSGESFVGVALENFTGGENNKVLTYISLGYSRLDSQISNGEISAVSELWSIDQLSGKIKPLYYLDLDGKDILNVKNILSASGKWSINEEGTLIVESIQTKGLRVGTKDNPKGVEMYDFDTKQLVCVFVQAGVIRSVQGGCTFSPEEESGPVSDSISILGCMNNAADNYNSMATVEDESCLYPEDDILISNEEVLVIDDSLATSTATSTEDVVQNSNSNVQMEEILIQDNNDIGDNVQTTETAEQQQEVNTALVEVGIVIDTVMATSSEEYTQQ